MTSKRKPRKVYNSYFARSASMRWRATIMRGAAENDHGELLPQCWNCIYYIYLHGRLGADWGVCAREGSARDGHVVFEHDGCDLHEETTDRL